MSSKKSRFRPSPALIVAFIALFVAMGGVGYTAVKLKKNAVKTKNIANGAVTTPKLATSVKAPSAANADKLGGLLPADFQGFCKPGAIKGSVVFNFPATVQTTYTPVQGFNCAQPGNTSTSVEYKRNGPQDYNVRFLGPTTTGSAVASAINAAASANPPLAVSTGVSGEFHIQGAGATEPYGVALLAF